jgi:hypothetical protein
LLFLVLVLVLVLWLLLGMGCKGRGAPSLAYPRRKKLRLHYANLPGLVMRSGHRTVK